MGKLLYPPTYGPLLDPDGWLPEYPPELYITDVSRSHVEKYLSAAKACIRNDEFYIEEGGKNESRLKNRAFIFAYGLHMPASLKRLLLTSIPRSSATSRRPSTEDCSMCSEHSASCKRPSAVWNPC